VQHDPTPQKPAMVRLIEALAERLVHDHLTENSSAARQKSELRPNHVNVAEPSKAA
jgi:hypothetical protein